MVRAKIGDERREQILSAFEACVIREGLAKTTLQKVADEAGLPRSLVRYFIGNRGDMVPLLIDRMIERADNDLSGLKPKDDTVSTADMVDFMFDFAFANETSNAIIGELWNLSDRDAEIRQRLAGLYQRMLDKLTEQMALDRIGRDERERKAAAHVLMSLGYGDASFATLFQKDWHRENAKLAAQDYLANLPSQEA